MKLGRSKKFKFLTKIKGLKYEGKFSLTDRKISDRYVKG